MHFCTRMQSIGESVHINIAQMQRAQMECVYSGAAYASICVERMTAQRARIPSLFRMQRGKFFISFFLPPAVSDGQHPHDVNPGLCTCVCILFSNVSHVRLCAC